MRKLAILAILFAAPAFANEAAPTPTIGTHYWIDYTAPSSSKDVTLGAQASACLEAGDAGCSTLLSATNVTSWPKVSIWCKNTGGANVVTQIAIEASPDGTNWTAVSHGLDALPATGKILQFVTLADLAVPWVRVEARSAAGTTVSCWISTGAP